MANKSLGETKSVICSSCHGLTGMSSDPMQPNLARQDAEYIINQLRAFKSGNRKSDIMESISASLTDDEIIALATFYSSQLLDDMKGEGDTLLIEKGLEKYSYCWSCHGENGEGPGSYPYIAGQHPKYTVQQLKGFKDGSRINPAMQAVVEELSVDDMEALGAYIATLRPWNIE